MSDIILLLHKLDGKEVLIKLGLVYLIEEKENYSSISYSFDGIEYNTLEVQETPKQIWADAYYN